MVDVGTSSAHGVRGVGNLHGDGRRAPRGLRGLTAHFGRTCETTHGTAHAIEKRRTKLHNKGVVMQW